MGHASGDSNSPFSAPPKSGRKNSGGPIGAGLAHLVAKRGSAAGKVVKQMDVPFKSDSYKLLGHAESVFVGKKVTKLKALMRA